MRHRGDSGEGNGRADARDCSGMANAPCRCESWILPWWWKTETASINLESKSKAPMLRDVNPSFFCRAQSTRKIQARLIG